MAIRIKSQQDYLLTESAVELPCNLAEVDYLMRQAKATGRIVAQYSQGGLLGVNVEQRAKIREPHSTKVRDMIGVGTQEIHGK